LVAEAFGKIKYVEKMGEGWDKIIDNFNNSACKVKMPEIIDTGSTVVVKIFSPKEMVDHQEEDLEDVGKNVGKNVGKKKRQELILEKVKKGSFNQRDFALEMGVNSKTIERDVRELKDKIKFVGSKKTGHWEVVDKKE